MNNLTNKFFSQITDLSQNANLFTNAADRLLGTFVSQKTADAKYVPCTTWTNSGCCLNDGGKQRQVRTCYHGGVFNPGTTYTRCLSGPPVC